MHTLIIEHMYNIYICINYFTHSFSSIFIHIERNPWMYNSTSTWYIHTNALHDFKKSVEFNICCTSCIVAFNKHRIQKCVVLLELYGTSNSDACLCPTFWHLVYSSRLQCLSKSYAHSLLPPTKRPPAGKLALKAMCVLGTLKYRRLRVHKLTVNAYTQSHPYAASCRLCVSMRVSVRVGVVRGGKRSASI